jgi:hypothetical protein
MASKLCVFDECLRKKISFARAYVNFLLNQGKQHYFSKCCYYKEIYIYLEKLLLSEMQLEVYATDRIICPVEMLFAAEGCLEFG